MDDTEEQDGDVLGDLAYVAAHLAELAPETVVLVLKSAMAEILDLRIAVQLAKAARQ